MNIDSSTQFPKTFKKSTGKKYADDAVDLIALSRLKNIPLIAQSFLKKVLSIHSVEQLAQVSVDELTLKLEEKGQFYTRQEIEGWLEAARDLVAQTTTWQSSANFIVSFQKRTMKGRVEHRTTFYLVEANRRFVWPGIECYGIYQLMREHFKKSCKKGHGEPITRILWPENGLKNVQSEASESDDTSGASKSIADLTLDVWMSEVKHSLEPQPDITLLVQPDSHKIFGSISEELPNCPIQESSDLSSDDKLDTAERLKVPESVNEGTLLEEQPIEPIKLEITQVKVYSPPETNNESADSETEGAKTQEAAEAPVIIADATKRVFLGELPKATPLDLEVSFQLTGTGALNLTKQPLLYQTEVYGENRTNHQKFILGSAPVGTLIEGKLTYTCRLTEVNLSETGNYRLQFFTQLENDLVRPDLLELPFVQVA